MANLSKIKRDQLLSEIDILQSKLDPSDNDSRSTLNKIRQEITNKKYGLVWEEHSEKVDEMLVDNIPVFTEDKSREIVSDPSLPYNFLIEGDNLHALKLLEKTHKGKIDVIYIDPPYNTGNSFTYNDTIVGNDDTFKHSKWLSFIKERLSLAYYLLSKKGGIFISIDEHEVAQLKVLCDNIFDEKNFVGCLIWRKKRGGGQTDEFFVTEHEYILCYRKSDEFRWIDAQKEEDLWDYKYDDKNGRFKIIKLEKWGTSAHREDRPTMYFPILDPDGNQLYPVAPDGQDGRWRVGANRLNNLINNDGIYWKKNGYRWVPYEKVYYSEENNIKLVKSRSILYELAETGDGSKLLTNIFGQKDVFSNPKPVELIHYILRHTYSQYVLDFFAGSGTTAQAVMKLNKDDNGNRKFILCTNNENRICEEVTYKRVSKVITGYSYKGKHDSVLLEQRVDLNCLKNPTKLEFLIDNTNSVIEENQDKFQKIVTKFENNVLSVIGTIDALNGVEGLPANLKYLKTEFVKRESEDLVSELLNHTKEMIELENHIEIDNKQYIMILSDEEADQLYSRWDDVKGTVKTLYVANNVLFTTEQKNLFEDVEIKIIPDNYFLFEMRESGEVI